MATRQHALFRQVPHPSPDVAKGGCYVYGTAGAGVDTGVLIDFEGTLYLSNVAIKEMAEVAGYSVNEEGAALEADNAHLRHELEKARTANLDLEEQLTAVGRLLSRAQKR